MNMTLFEAIISEAIFHMAWQRVRSNLGAPGIDKVSVEEFERNLQDNLSLLRSSVKDGSYQPLPLMTFTKAKESGQTRTLHNLCVRDKIVQQAVLLVIQPIYERIFLQCSYAYRPGRSAQKAIERVERNIKRGRVWIFDADIKNYFDSIDRKLLLEQVAQTITEKPVLQLIEKCINAFENSENKGVAQGMLLAPLLSNVYLHKMDDCMTRADWNYIRYSDNILTLCTTEEKAREAQSRAETCLKELTLSFNAEKTKVGHLRDGFTFLGFYFDEKGKKPAPSSVINLEKRIDGALQKALHYSEAQLHEKLESIVRGWLNYFQLAQTDRQQLLQELENRFAGQENSFPQRILRSSIALQLGDPEKAQAILQSGSTEVSEDAEINCQWATICDLLGLDNEALDSYLAAFRANAEHPEAAYRLGLHYLQQHQTDKAIRYLQKAIQNNPRDAGAHFALATAFQQFSLPGAANKIFQRAFQIDPNLRQFRTEMSPAIKHEEKPSSPVICNEDAEFVLHLFSGREGVYAKQWLSDDGRLGYSTVNKPLTIEDIQSHIAGKDTLGYYLMRSDNTVNQLVIDIDISKQARLEAATDQDQIKDWQHFIWSDVAHIMQVLSAFSITSYAEDSGYKGIHVWVFFNEPLPARDILLFAKKILAAAGNPPTGLHREIFPKEEHVAGTALGSMIKMPLGMHKSTGRACLFLDNQAQPYTDQVGFLKNIERITSNRLHAAIDQLKTPVIAGSKNDKPNEALEKLLKGCNIIRFLAEKAEKEKMLSHTDRLTLLSVFGYLGESGHDALHSIIGKTLNYNYRITERWFKRPKGLPVSCPKIRIWQSHITPAVGCYCKFPEIKNSYPSPVLHIDAKLIATLRGKLPKEQPAKPVETAPSAPVNSDVEQTRTMDSKKEQPPVQIEIEKLPTPPPKQPTPVFKIEKLVQDYLKCKKESHRLQEKIIELETQLTAAFEHNQIDHLATALGVFKRIKENDHYKWIIEI